MKSFGALLVATLLPATMASAQPRVEIAERGPGAAGRLLQDVLDRPHRLVEPDTGWFVMNRGDQESASLIVLGRSAAIAGVVAGDVVVVGGDLHVRPGGRIDGRAIAIGGGVYLSMLARGVGGRESFRDETFEIARMPEGYRLTHRAFRSPPPPLEWPGVRGLRLPTYDRVNGVSLPIGPRLSFLGGRGSVEALATYRSDLGKVDPSAIAELRFAPLYRARIAVARGTFTNDGWIWSDFVNSLAALVTGTDTRNYYRGDRLEITGHRRIEGRTVQLEPFAGARVERAWSVGPHVGATGGPWSIFGRRDSLGMLRPNPGFPESETTSALAGSTVEYESGGLRARGTVFVQHVLDASFDGGGGGAPGYSQVTSDARVEFPTIRTHSYQADLHWVTTVGDTPLPQHFAYFGGPGTMPFLDLLEQGGDELLLIDQRYSIPLPNIQLRLVGSPTVYLRHRIGSAGLGALPQLEQALGFGVQLRLIRGEIQLNPANGDVRVSAGLSFAR